MSNYTHFSKIYILVIVLLWSVFGAHARDGASSEPSLWSLAENRKAKAHARLTAKWKYFHGFLTFTDGEYACEM